MIKNKIQKPIEIDAHLKYRCPKCGWDRWISLKESQAKNFKIVCDCNTIFKPKRIKSLNINYYNKIKKKQKEPQPSSVISDATESVAKPIDPVKPLIDQSVLEKCSNILIQYGFTKNEANKLINRAYDKLMDNDIGSLIKTSLEIIGENKYE